MLKRTLGNLYSLNKTQLNGVLEPVADDQIILGTASKRFRTIYTNEISPSSTATIDVPMPTANDTMVLANQTQTVQEKTLVGCLLRDRTRFYQKPAYTQAVFVVNTTPYNSGGTVFLNNFFVLGDPGGPGTFNMPSASALAGSFGFVADFTGLCIEAKFSNISIVSWTINIGAGMTDQTSTGSKTLASQVNRSFLIRFTSSTAATVYTLG